MSTFRVDPNKVLELLKKYRPEAGGKSEGGGAQEIKFLCPFHLENNPSFSFNVAKGVGRCASCHASATLSKLVANFEGKTEKAVKKIVESVVIDDVEEEEKRGPGRPASSTRLKACTVPMQQITTWHEALITSASEMDRFVKRTRIPASAVERFKLGIDGEAYTIPLIVDGVLVNVKHYNPGGNPKYWGVTGANENILWPMENIQNRNEIWLMEGEKDCMVACSHGFNAVTFTGGAKSFSKGYLRFFRDKTVNICYDIDDAGRDGATKIANILHRVAASVKIINLPIHDQMPTNGDFTDFATAEGADVLQVAHIASLTESHKGDSAITKIPIPDTVYDTYLENIITKKLWFKRVRMRVRVTSIAMGKAYLVPRDIRAVCSKDWKDMACMSCPMFYQEDSELEMVMRPTYPEILQVIDGNDKKQKEAIRSMMDIQPGCPKFKIECKSHQSIYPIVLIPALEKDKPYHTYTMQVAWALDLPAQPNEDYLCEATIVNNPDTQGLAVIVYDLKKDVSSVDEFELSPELIEQLGIFSCQPLTKSTENSLKSMTTSVPTLPSSTDDPISTSPSTSSTIVPSASDSTESS